MKALVCLGSFIGTICGGICVVAAVTTLQIVASLAVMVMFLSQLVVIAME